MLSEIYIFASNRINSTIVNEDKYLFYLALSLRLLFAAIITLFPDLRAYLFHASYDHFYHYLCGTFTIVWILNV